MRKNPLKLTLNKETVRNLSRAERPENGNQLTQSSCLPRCTCPPALQP